MTSPSLPALDMPPLPSLDELLSGLRVVRIPLAVKFRGVTEREAALLRGPCGWGEFSPFLEYGPGEASTWLSAAIEAAWLGFPDPVRDRVPVNLTVPAVSPDRVESVLARYGAGALDADGAGVSIKVKVAERGETVRDDDARVAEVRRLAPRALIRVDANMGWGDPARLADARSHSSARSDSPAAPHPEDTALAVEALTRLAEHGLQYAEQPVATVPGLRAVRQALAARGIPLKIAADESIRRAGDPLRVAREEAADVVVVKYAPLGGARRALRIIEASGLPAVVSSALDTSVGLSAGVALAAALPELDYACGLGTLSLAEEDVAVAPLRLGEPVRGREHALTLPAGPCAVDEEQAERLAASPDRRAAWEERIAACHRLLAAERERGAEGLAGG